MERPEIREAVYVASPSLESGLDFWRRAPESKKGRKVERSLLSYLLRMSSRSTPFGLFAGCSVGRVGGRTSLRLDGIEECRRRTHLDMTFLGALCVELNRDERIRWGQTYTFNEA
ncbi:MAG: lantibiotic dehydratase, partial [Planctomycetota bacterium]|nr:lantibiotic dehydratase [Planctomycetota bacterium]